MPDVKISELPEFTADPAGVFIPMVNAGETETFKILRENLVGDSGTSGSSGTSGAPGTSGSSGTSGIDGSSGSSGTSGDSGSSGSSGTSGIDGSSGSSGTSGIDGSSGSSGTSGIDGSSGSSGSSGTSGDTGAPGTSGTSGTSGTGGGGGGFTWPSRISGGPGYSGNGSAIPGPTGSHDRLFACMWYETGTNTWTTINPRIAFASTTADVINFAIYNSQHDETYGLVPYQRVTEIFTLNEAETASIGVKTRTFATPWTPTEGVYWFMLVYTNATSVNPTARFANYGGNSLIFTQSFIGQAYGLVVSPFSSSVAGNAFYGPSLNVVGLRYDTAGPLANSYVAATLAATASGNGYQAGFLLE